MSERLPIDRYIASTKLNCQERVDPEMYRETLAYVAAFTDGFDLKVAVRLVYTPTRRAERVEVSGQNWLIYDQYLGQTMNLLNRIYFEADSEQASIVYFHKYLAERALDLGCAILGVHFANYYDAHRDVLQPRRIDEARRGAYTKVHERFAIYHELGHEILSLDDSYVRFMKQHVADVIQHRRETFNSESVEQLLSQFLSADPAVYHEVDFKTYKAETENVFNSVLGQRSREAYSAQLDNPDTAIELFCDFVAADFILADLTDFLSLEEIIRAIYVGSYHLKTMMYFDWHCLHMLHGKNKQSDLEVLDQGFLQSIQVRNHALKSHLLFVYQAKLVQGGSPNAEELARNMNRTLMVDQRRYYESIFDPAAKLLTFAGEDGQLGELADVILERLPDRYDHTMIEKVAVFSVLMQTGWPLTLVKDKYGAE